MDYAAVLSDGQGYLSLVLEQFLSAMVTPRAALFLTLVMTATSRSQVVEQSTHSTTQRLSFVVLSLLCMGFLFVGIASPLLNMFFSGFLRSEVISDGTIVTYQVAENRATELVTTGPMTTWALADPRLAESSRPHAEYIFKPIIALAPLVFVGGTILAALITVLLPKGLLRQKIDREILLALDRLAVQQFGEHSNQEVQSLAREIASADTRRLHDLADRFKIGYSELELMQRALLWKNSSGASRLLRMHDAVKFYMREYFTDRYSNVILGLVYMGAAVLIIVIGIRGLKFLPATDPSFVLSALGLEFMLLITYATILMYGRTEENAGTQVATTAYHDFDSRADTEQLIRALLTLPRQHSGDKK